MASTYTDKQIGNYRALRKIGAGSFSCVYLAEHTILKNEPPVAIKLLYLAQLNSTKELESFKQEAELLRQLRHPYILPLIDAGISQDVPYLVVQYAPGGSLRNRLQQWSPNPLPLQEAMTILTQVGQALQYAHEHNIVHRDLKPENILLNEKDEALVADLGLATKLGTTSLIFRTVAGTPAYMAPEQFGGIVSKETDLYALACIAYELFTGRQPFPAEGFPQLMFQHQLATPLPPTSLNPRLSTTTEAVVLKAMAKGRSDRYQDVEAFINALHESIAYRSASPIPSPTGNSGSDTTLPDLKAIALKSENEPTQPLQNDLHSGSKNAFSPPYVPTEPIEYKANGHGNLSTTEHLSPPTVISHPPLPHSTTTEYIPPPTAASLSPLPHPIPSGNHHNQKASRRRLFIAAAVVALILALIPWSVAALYTFAYPASATVTITPSYKVLQSTFHIPISQNPDPSQGQVAGVRPLSFHSKPRTGLASATGNSHTTATHASGEVTFNSYLNTDLTVNAGQTFITSSGLTVIIDEPFGLPIGLAYTAKAHIYQPGTVSNISPYDLACNCYYNHDSQNGYVQVYNSKSFSGGQNAETHTFVQQSDITRAAKPLETPLEQNAKTSLEGLVKTPLEAFLSASEQCTPQIIHDKNVGDAATTFHVVVSVTCTGEAYDSNPAYTEAANQLASQVNMDIGPSYVLVDKIATTIFVQPTIIDQTHSTLLLNVIAKGIWVFDPNNIWRQRLLELIAGKTQQQAQSLLSHESGVGKAQITLSDSFWVWNSIPTNFNRITVMITPMNTPDMQIIPTSAIRFGTKAM